MAMMALLCFLGLALGLALGLLLCMLMVQLVNVVRSLWWEPRSLQRALRLQGIHGPDPKFLIGNYIEIMKLEAMEMEADMPSLCHDILCRMLPYYTKWKETYGKHLLITLLNLSVSPLNHSP